MYARRILKICLAGLVVAIMLIMIMIFIIPYYVPLTFTGMFVPYEYTLERNSAIINEYIGDEEEVFIPSSILFHRVTELAGKEKSTTANGPFYKNENVKKVTIPDTVITLSKDCFEECVNLEEVKLSSNLKSIERGCFNGCISLKFITFPDGLEKIGSITFCRCESLKSITLPDSILILDSVFINCTSLEEVIIPEQLTNIDGHSFLNTPWRDTIKEEFITVGKNCLIGYNGTDKEVYVPDGVEYIGKEVFENESIETLYIPKSVIQLDMSTFHNNKNLQYLILENDKIVLDGNIWENPNLTIIAPPGSTAEQYAIEHKIPYKQL